MPRWNFENSGAQIPDLGCKMKSVGEVMAIEDHLMRHPKSLSVLEKWSGRASVQNKKEWFNTQIFWRGLKSQWWPYIPTKGCIASGGSRKSVQKLTGIDPWFIREIKHLVHLDEQIARYNVPEDPDTEFMTELKRTVIPTRRSLAHAHRRRACHTHRRKLGLRAFINEWIPALREFDAVHYYYYSTFDDHNESRFTLAKRIMVWIRGPTGWSSGNWIWLLLRSRGNAIRELGMEAIMINCNPETVSNWFRPGGQVVFWTHFLGTPLEGYHRSRKSPMALSFSSAARPSAQTFWKIHRKGIQIVGTSYMIVWTLRKTGRFSESAQRWIFHTWRYGVALRCRWSFDSR